MITRTGVGLAAGSTVLVLFGWFTGYRIPLAVGLAGLVVVVFALGWVGYRPQLDVVRTVEPDRVAVGGTATGLITVTNVGRRPCPRMVAREEVSGTVVEVDLPRLAPGASSSTPYGLPTGRRGVLDVGPLALHRADPFGLVATTKHYGDVRTLWVHPRSHVIAPTPSGRSRDLDGPTSDTAPQGGIVFHTLREYVRGDDRRLIHWRSTARTGTLMVRHLVDASQPVTTVVLDTRRSSYEGELFEVAVEAAASIALASVRSHFPMRFLSTSGIALGGIRKAIRASDLLDVLAGIETSADDDLLDVTRRALTATAGGSVVVVTGGSGDADSVALTRLRSGFDRMILVRVRGREAATSAPFPRSTVVDASSADDFVRSWQRLGRT